MSDEDCRNDCVLPPVFPRRPGTQTATAHGGECPCGCRAAGGVSADNRPALPHFNYRIGNYGSIREFLFHQLNKTPELGAWTHREPDDPAVALIDGAAILGDILTFYQETYANESFLRTAVWRESISDLVRLLGYRLSPPVGGKATFAFELKKDEPVTIPVGFPLKATLEDLPKPADFETLEEITAYPSLNRFNLFRPLEKRDITSETTEFRIAAPNQFETPIPIVAGDRLMIGESNADGLDQPSQIENAEIVIVESVRELHGAQIFKIKGKLKRKKSIENLVAYKIGRTFHHFGHNSPDRIVDESKPVTSTSTVTDTTTSSSTTIPMLTVAKYRPVDETLIDDAVDMHFGPKEFPLDTDVGPFPNNVPIIVQAGVIGSNQIVATWARPPHRTYVGTVGSHKTITAKWGAISGTVTQLNLLTTLGFKPAEASSSGAMETASDMSIADELVDQVGEFEFSAVDSKSEVFAKEPTFSEIGASDSLDLGESGEFGQIGEFGEVDDLTFTAEKFRMYIGDALFHEVLSPLFRIERPAREKPGTTGSKLNFYGTAAEVKSLLGRRLMFVKNGAEPYVLTVNQVPVFFVLDTADFPLLRQIGLSGEVSLKDFPNQNPFVTIFGNLVDADEGKTLPELPIGSGDAKQIFQNFKLPKAPLTYHIVPENTPSETPELAIFVDGREWRVVDSFFGRGREEQVFVVREDADGNSWVQFGDGKTGARLTTGVNNVTAVYRVGDGAFGPLKADTKVQASAKLKNLDKIGMPTVATGGAPAEDGENARQAAPGKVQSLGRIVSLRDFESETAAIPGVAAATASWRVYHDVPVVRIVVLMETGRAKEVSAVGETIARYNKERGAGRDPVKVIAGGRSFVTAKVEYGLRDGYRADLVEPEIRRALGVNFGKATRDEDQGGLFSLRRRRFGGAEYASSVEAWVQNVEGVVWARVTSFVEMAKSDSESFNADDPETYVLPADKLEKTIACPAAAMLSLYDKHLFLTTKEATD